MHPESHLEVGVADTDQQRFWPLRVVLERRTVARSGWEVDSWSAIEVESERGIQHNALRVEAGPESTTNQRFIWTGLGLELFRDERAAYRFNLSSAEPRLFLVCAQDDDEEAGLMRPYLVTASQDEAAAYMDGGEEDVFSVPMPEAVQCWIEGFIARHGEPDLGLRKGKRRRYRGARKEESDRG